MSDFHGVLYIELFPAHQQVMREMGNFEEGRSNKRKIGKKNAFAWRLDLLPRICKKSSGLIMW